MWYNKTKLAELNMKKFILPILFALIAIPFIGYASIFNFPSLNLGDGNINTLDQFTSTTSPSTSITQRIFGKSLRLSGYDCTAFGGGGKLTTDVNGVVSCAADGGGGGGGTPGGSNTQIQFNDSSSFGGSANATFTKGNGLTTLTSLLATFATSTNLSVTASSTIQDFTFRNGLGSLFALGTSSPYLATLNVESGTASTTNIFSTGNVNNFLENMIQNRSAGNTASSDFVTTANIGTASTYYTDLGINNSGYSQALFSAQNPLDSYLYSSDSALVLSTASTTNPLADLRITTGGTASTSIRMTFKPSGFAGMGTTTPQWLLQLASSTAPQLTLSDGVNNHWSFRNAGGVFYLATSSPTTFATSTPPAFMISTTGQVGIGTTTANASISTAGPSGINIGGVNNFVPYLVCQSGVDTGTPADTSEDTIFTCPIPANSMMANGSVTVIFYGHTNNSAGNKNFRAHWGGTGAGAASTTIVNITVTGATGVSTKGTFDVMNSGATNSQFLGNNALYQSNTGWGAASATTTATSVDTTALQYVTVTCTKTVATDFCGVAHYRVTVNPSN